MRELNWGKVGSSIMSAKSWLREHGWDEVNAYRVSKNGRYYITFDGHLGIDTGWYMVIENSEGALSGKYWRVVVFGDEVKYIRDCLVLDDINIDMVLASLERARVEIQLNAMENA